MKYQYSYNNNYHRTCKNYDCVYLHKYYFIVQVGVLLLSLQYSLTCLSIDKLSYIVVLKKSIITL